MVITSHQVLTAGQIRFTLQQELNRQHH